MATSNLKNDNRDYEGASFRLKRPHHICLALLYSNGE